MQEEFHDKNAKNQSCKVDECALIVLNAGKLVVVGLVDVVVEGDDGSSNEERGVCKVRKLVDEVVICQRNGGS